MCKAVKLIVAGHGSVVQHGVDENLLGQRHASVAREDSGPRRNARAAAVAHDGNAVRIDAQLVRMADEPQVPVEGILGLGARMLGRQAVADGQKRHAA